MRAPDLEPLPPLTEAEKARLRQCVEDGNWRELSDAYRRRPQAELDRLIRFRMDEGR